MTASDTYLYVVLPLSVGALALVVYGVTGWLDRRDRRSSH